jgi:hypothetical protein
MVKCDLPPAHQRSIDVFERGVMGILGLLLKELLKDVERVFYVSDPCLSLQLTE